MNSRQQLVTEGIVLSRTNFGEADRIITMLTPDRGKLRLIAKGVRRSKSKLAGGIELFSVSQITYIPGKSEIHTLVSTRLKKYYRHIVEDIQRTMLGYELLKRMNRATEDVPEPEYFELLTATLQALDGELSLGILELWFDARLLLLAGHQPNLQTDLRGQRLRPDQTYSFDVENMTFAAAEQGIISPSHIKLLRLIFGLADPTALAQVGQVQSVLGLCAQLVSSMRQQYIRE